MDWLTQHHIAHRGLHEGFSIPENSLLSFQKAINNNFAIALEIRITKDKQIIVFRDKTLLRVCAINKKISTLPYSKIKKIPLYNSNHTIPLLKDVLNLVNDQVPIIIEVKNYSEVGLFETILMNQLDQYKGRIAICSSNIEVIKWFKEYRPHILRGFIYGDLHKSNIRFYKTVFLYSLLSSAPDFISLDYKLLNTLLPKICRLFNKQVLCWTVNNKKKMKKAKQLTHNIIFENIKP